MKNLHLTLIDVAEPDTDPLERMKDYLGENWVLHPNYKFRPRHSNDAAVWQPHSILTEVRNRAISEGRL
jgi:hypothetical protein